MMKNWIPLLSLLLLPFSSPLFSAEKCSIEPLSMGQRPLAAWVDQDNWLAPENLRFGLRSAGQFMPLIQIKSPLAQSVLRPASPQLDLDRIKVSDPLDQEQRGIGNLLDTRLYADAIVVLHNGRIVSEKYWHGLPPSTPRLLLDGTRPVLSLIGAMAVAQEKLVTDKSIIRIVPELSGQTGLRKLSVQRLLDAKSRFDWSADEITSWQAAGGWRSGDADADMRSWLNQPNRWERKMVEASPDGIEAGPEGDLLAWALAESYRQPLAQVFCENVQSRFRPENSVFWATDRDGTELSNGLALSLRDFSRLGQMLIDARSGRARSRLPSWFIETLTASRGIHTSDQTELAGLRKGSAYRYGFIHLGGDPNRIAILGAHGNSLYVDFERRLVIAIFASYPKMHGAGVRTMLERVWDAVGSTIPVGKKR